MSSVREVTRLMSLLVDKNPVVNRTDELFNAAVERLISSDVYKQLSKDFGISNEFYCNKPIRWQFACLCLDLLRITNSILKNEENDKQELFSPKQEVLLKSCITFVVSLGMLPYFMPGIAPSPESRCKNWHLLEPEVVDELEKHRRLKYITMKILALYYDRKLSHLIVPDFLNELLCALCQFCFAPIIKPNSLKESPNVSNGVVEAKKNPGLEKSFVMTEEIWDEVQQDRQILRVELQNFMDHLYQPLVIQHLMMLLTNKEKIPRSMWKSICTLLHQRVTRDGGLTSTIRAICDNNLELLSHSSKLDQITTLFTGAFSQSSEQRENSIVPQLLDIVRMKGDGVFEDAYRRVGAFSISRLYETDDNFTRTCIIYELMRPLLYPSTTTSEDEIRQCITDLHTCFASLPADNVIHCLPCDLLSPVIRTLFSIYRLLDEDEENDKDNGDIALILPMVKRLLEKYFTDVYQQNSDLLATTLYDLTFFYKIASLENDDSVAQNLKVTFGPANGIVFVTDDDNNNSSTAIGDKNDSSLNEEAGKVLLNFLSDCCRKEFSSQMIGVYFVGLLEQFQQYLLTAPESIIRTLNLNAILHLLELIVESNKLHSIPLRSSLRFVDSVHELLKKFSSSSLLSDTQKRIMHACLLITYAMIQKSASLKSSDKLSEFDVLKRITPFKHLEKGLYDETTRLLATQVYEKFLERYRSVKGKLIGVFDQTVTSKYKVALADAHDGMIPVRAKGVATLIKLFQQNDPETTANYITLYCLFYENLKHDDSFLYVRAADGLATVIAELPDVFLSKLCDEYMTMVGKSKRENSNSKWSLKLGEVFLKIVVKLDSTDHLKIHKGALLNVFFRGIHCHDVLLRASGLSNLAEMCLLLNINLINLIPEIFNTAVRLAEWDPAPEVRRAGTLVLTSIIKGFSAHIEEVPKAITNHLYHVLQKLYTDDGDNNVRLHAQLGLEEYTRCVKAAISN